MIFNRNIKTTCKVSAKKSYRKDQNYLTIVKSATFFVLVPSQLFSFSSQGLFYHPSTTDTTEKQSCSHSKLRQSCLPAIFQQSCLAIPKLRCSKQTCKSMGNEMNNPAMTRRNITLFLTHSTTKI